MQSTDRKTCLAAQYVRAKFQSSKDFTEENAEQVFAQYSGVGLADMLIAAERQGGFTEKIIIDNLPDSLQGDNISLESIESFWQTLEFFTTRFKWTALPGCSSSQTIKKSKTKKKSYYKGHSTIKSKVIEALGGEENALAKYEKLIAEHKTVQGVIDHLESEKGVTGLKRSNMENILTYLRGLQDSSEE